MIVMSTFSGTGDINDDELLPLATFSSCSFSVSDLARKRLLISQSEMLKLMSDYERAIKIELISLVNDNYQAFLQLSHDIQAITVKSSTLKETIQAKYESHAGYQGLRTKFLFLISQSKQVREELGALANEKQDIAVLTSIIDLLVNTEYMLTSSDLHEKDLGCIVKEFSRVSVMVEVMNVWLSEQVRTSLILQECMPVLLDRRLELRTKLVAHLMAVLQANLAKPEEALILEICKSLILLGAKREVISTLKAAVFATPLSPDWNNLGLTFEELREKYFSGTLFRVAEQLGLVSEVILKESLAVLSKNVSVFVPTDLEVFHANFLASEFFLRDRELHACVLEYRAKWQLGLYLSMRVKSSVHSMEELENILPKLVLRPDLLPQLVELLVERMDGWRKPQAITGDEYLRLTRLAQETDQMGLKIVPFTNSEVGKIFSIQARLISNSAEALLSSIVHAVGTPISTVLDSVKQVSALYRVASARPPPTRHSVYVDLAWKGVGEFLLRMAQDPKLVSLVGTRLAQSVLPKYQKSCAELLVRERARGGAEVEKIEAQLELDRLRLLELFQRDFPSTEVWCPTWHG